MKNYCQLSLLLGLELFVELFFGTVPTKVASVHPCHLPVAAIAFCRAGPVLVASSAVSAAGGSITCRDGSRREQHQALRFSTHPFTHPLALSHTSTLSLLFIARIRAEPWCMGSRLASILPSS